MVASDQRQALQYFLLEDLEAVQGPDSVDHIFRHLSTCPFVKLSVVLLDRVCPVTKKGRYLFLGTVNIRDGPFLCSLEIEDNCLQSFEGTVTTLVGELDELFKWHISMLVAIIVAGA